MVAVAAMWLMAAQAGDWPWRPDVPADAHPLGDRPLRIDGRWNAAPARVRLTQGIVAHCRAVAAGLNGAVPDRLDRCRRLARVEVTVAGRALGIAPAAYRDLAGINSVVVRFSRPQATLFVQGPGGPDWYAAALRIDRDGTVHRRLDPAFGGTERRTFPPEPPRRPPARR